MNLLAAKLYDPGTAVSKATSSLIAMTAFDTTNLRLAITVPAHGMVMFKLRTTITGATTVPTVLLGVLNGATVLGRVTPQDFPGTMNAATQSCPCQCEFIVTGLTPGAMNVDAAYGVEVVVAATNIKYGGPNNTTTNDAWGAFCFEAWDPQPNPTNFGSLAITGLGVVSANIGVLPTNFSSLSIDGNGRVDVIKVAGTTQTARDLGASVLLSSGTGTGQLDFTSGVVKANLAQILGTALTETAGQIAAAFKKFFNIATPASTMDALTLVATATNLTNAPTAGDFTSTMKTSIGTAVAASAVASVTGNVGGNVTGSVGSVVGLTASNLDTTVSSRLASASYTAPDNTTIAAIAGYVDTEVAAIKAKTDQLVFTAAGYLDVNTLKINGVTIVGDGVGTPMGA